mgnify:CR=1 FL=1
MQVDGKVVLITGASEGIGAACARAFARRGARLALTARSRDRLLEAGGADALVVAGDLTEAVVRRQVVEETLARYGRIDILVNNAGVGLYTAAWRASPAAARKMFELNFFALLELTQLVVPQMREQGGGAIVNVSSIAGKAPFPWLTLYCASKYAVCALSDGLRMELKPYRIQVTTVCPGHVETGFGEHALEGRLPERIRRTRKFPVTAEECAEALVRGLERGKRTVMIPRVGWLLVALERLAPTLMDSLMARMYHAAEPPA